MKLPWHHAAARKVPQGSPRAVSFNAETWKAVSAWSALTFAISLGVGLFAWSWYLDRGNEGAWGAALRNADDVPSEVMAPAIMKRRAIDGLPVPETEDDAARRYYAVMIDNITVARPQAGIAAASVVYEVPVEGGLTRYMAVFPDTAAAERIGPVRSARAYFIDWALEYDALYAHVGGSPEALQKLVTIGARDLNEFSSGAYFWRDRQRSAPHNTYTSSEDLAEAYETRFGDRVPKPLRGWVFKDEVPAEDRPAAQKLVVSYEHPNVDAVWTYDPSTNDYARKQGKTTADEEGVPVRAKNIVVQYLKTATIDAVGRLRIGTIGEGEALIVLDGNAYHGTWRKASAAGRTTFHDASGAEIALNAGPTWVQAVPEDAEVTVTP